MKSLEKVGDFNLYIIIVSLVKFTASERDVELINVPSASATTTDMSVISDKELDMTKCSKERKGCCKESDLGDKDTVTKCFTINESKLPPEGDKDLSKSIRWLSCWVECIYKQKKYVGKGDTINMDMVKSDAAKMYEHRPKEYEYYIDMLEFCRKDGSSVYNNIKANPAAKLLLRNNCKPYLMFVYLCQADYHKKHACPYFKWQDKTNATNKVCKVAKEKCYELEGIKL